MTDRASLIAVACRDDDVKALQKLNPSYEELIKREGLSAWTPLSYAAHNNRLVTLRMLIGFHPRLITEHKLSGVRYQAIVNGHLDLLQWLETIQPESIQPDNDALDGIYHACKSNQLEVLKWFAAKYKGPIAHGKYSALEAAYRSNSNKIVSGG